MRRLVGGCNDIAHSGVERVSNDYRHNAYTRCAYKQRVDGTSRIRNEQPQPGDLMPRPLLILMLVALSRAGVAQNGAASYNGYACRLLGFRVSGLQGARGPTA